MSAPAASSGNGSAAAAAAPDPDTPTFKPSASNGKPNFCADTKWLHHEQVPAFSYWAASVLLGVAKNERVGGSVDSKQMQMFEALHTIAALYLRADIEGIKSVVDSYKLTEVMAAYVSDQIRSSIWLSGLDLSLKDQGMILRRKQQQTAACIPEIENSTRFQELRSRQAEGRLADGVQSPFVDQNPWRRPQSPANPRNNPRGPPNLSTVSTPLYTRHNSFLGASFSRTPSISRISEDAGSPPRSPKTCDAPAASPLGQAPLNASQTQQASTSTDAFTHASTHVSMDARDSSAHLAHNDHCDTSQAAHAASATREPGSGVAGGQQAAEGTDAAAAAVCSSVQADTRAMSLPAGAAREGAGAREQSAREQIAREQSAQEQSAQGKQSPQSGNHSAQPGKQSAQGKQSLQPGKHFAPGKQSAQIGAQAGARVQKDVRKKAAAFAHDFRCTSGGCQIMTYLMQELEALMTTYLSCNWHRREEVMDANADDLREGGLLCALPLRSTPSGSSPSLSSATPMSLANASAASNASLSSLATSGSGESTVSARARHNWQRACKAALKWQVVQTFRPLREFQTMQQIIKALDKPQQDRGGRAPVILFLGGGMAAGKSTVREIIGQDSFWSAIGPEAVVIEADAIKNQDLVYQRLKAFKTFSNDDSLASLVHEWSTQKAETMLVEAVNRQKDIIFDGTCSWAPFVRQTIEMVRDHRNLYRRGPGYEIHEDGSVTERYWIIDNSVENAESAALRETATLSRGGTGSGDNIAGKCTPSGHSAAPAKPRAYRIELTGVTCNPALAVARGVWRRLRTGRGVPVTAQLKSYRSFAENWPQYCSLVDSATLYHTGSALTTLNKDAATMEKPRVIAHKSPATRGEMLVNPQAYPEFVQQAQLQVDASGEAELYCDRSCAHQAFMQCPLQHDKRVSVLRSAFGFAKERHLL